MDDMENEDAKNGVPDISELVSGLEILPCHRCSEPGVVNVLRRRDNKFSVSIGCQCKVPYSTIFNGKESVDRMVNLWNSYQRIHSITRGGR